MAVEEVGRLEAYGFDEPEPGLIEDTQENRSRLIEMKWRWQRDLDDEGHFTGLIKPIDAEEVTASREELAKRKRPLLSDPRNPWSDFKHPDELDVDLELPSWVRSRLRKWREDEADGVPEADRRTFPTRCATTRYDGTRCWNWVNRPDENPRCTRHTNANKQELRSAAAYSRQQLIDLLPGAVDNLAYLAFHADGEAVRLKANTEIMDRAGLSSKTEIDLTATVQAVDPAEALKEKLEMLRKRHTPTVTEEPDEDRPLALPAADIVEAEIIEEEAV